MGVFKRVGVLLDGRYELDESLLKDASGLRRKAEERQEGGERQLTAAGPVLKQSRVQPICLVAERTALCFRCSAGEELRRPPALDVGDLLLKRPKDGVDLVQ